MAQGLYRRVQRVQVASPWGWRKAATSVYKKRVNTMPVWAVRGVDLLGAIRVKIARAASDLVALS
eukprot:1223495-Lingulodinium_polyedra.AAC.1